VNGCDEGGHSFLVPDLEGELVLHHHCDVICKYLIDAIYQIEEVFFYSHFTDNFSHNGVLIF